MKKNRTRAIVITVGLAAGLFLGYGYDKGKQAAQYVNTFQGALTALLMGTTDFCPLVANENFLLRINPGFHVACAIHKVEFEESEEEVKPTPAPGISL